jgi:hypothetical protein
VDGWIYVFLVFILAAMVVIIVAILISQQARANVRLPGRAEFFIEVDKGWRRAPKTSRPPKPVSGQRPAAAKGQTARRSSRTRLVAKVRGGPDWEFSLEGRNQVFIGRRQDNDLVLRDPDADTRQAVIYWESERFKINNLSSQSPTRVNGRPITKQNLGDGNTIQMGRTKLIFRQEKDPK